MLDPPSKEPGAGKDGEHGRQAMPEVFEEPEKEVKPEHTESVSVVEILTALEKLLRMMAARSEHSVGEIMATFNESMSLMHAWAQANEEEELKRRGMTAFLNKMSVPGVCHAMKKLKHMKSDANS